MEKLLEVKDRSILRELITSKEQGFLTFLGGQD